MTVLSDVGVVLELQENVYWQAFCGMEQFETGKKLDASSLTKIRHKLGVNFTRALEKKTYQVLVEKKIIRGEGMLVDATVMPEKIRYPNDIGLLNDVREWTVGWLKEIVGKTGEKVRTYRRKARKLFLNFSKKKIKTWQMIERTKKQMPRYVRRNLEQLKGRVGQLDYLVREEVEFGPKVCLSHVDGFTFLDEFSHENYSEARVDIVKKQIENYEERFGQKPPSMTGDQLYGNRGNRELLKVLEIRPAFKPLGRKGEESQRQERYLRRKQRERNRIEGDIGNVKEHYGLDGIRYHYVEGSEMWVRMGLLAKNLKAAMTRMALSPTG